MTAFDNGVPVLKAGLAPSRAVLLGAFLLLILAAAQATTQTLAEDFAYQPSLGPSAFGIYPPWAFITWKTTWASLYPAAFAQAEDVGLFVLLLGLLGLALAKAALAARNPFIHGSARWATRKDLEKAGLLVRSWGKSESVDEPSVYVGAWRDARGRLHYLRHSGPEHVLVKAPTRSGKGVGLVVPTLLSWPASVLVSDLKGELWELTAGWRQRGAGNRVLRFEPAAAGNTVRWNPLDEVRLGTPHEVGDVESIATLLVDPDGKGLESHWQKTAFALLVGVILHVAYRGRLERKPASLAQVGRLLADPSRPSRDLWEEMTEYLHCNGENHPVVGAAGRDMLDRPEEEAGSVLSTAKSYLSLYRNPVVATNTSTSDFQLRDLMHSESPVALYLVTKPGDKDRLVPFLRILVSMAFRLNCEDLAFENGRPKALYKHRLLPMLDEFIALRRLPILEESLAYCAGYGIKAYLICQDDAQLRSRTGGYGPDETISANCHIQIAFPPNQLQTAENLSRMTGQTTDKHTQVTRRGGGLLANRDRSEQLVQRPLLTPDQCLRLPGPEKDSRGMIRKPGAMLIFAAGMPAVYGVQPLYFQDPIFSARACIPAPAEADS